MSLRASVQFRRGTLELRAELETGEGTLALVGPNGAGKTSLLLSLLGVVPAVQGRIEVGGHVLLDRARGVDLPLEDRRLGYVPQDYGLFPHLTVQQNIEFALASRNLSGRRQRVGRALGDLGIEAWADRYPDKLSGGEKQRVALARALSVEPRALLLDEPLSALDVRAQLEIGSFLNDYLRRLSLPTIVVLHRATDAKLLGQRIAVLEAGRLTQIGTWDELQARPASRYVEAFVASASLGAASAL